MSQRGFTLVETIVAMSIFSFMLLIMTAGVLSLFRIYEAGVQIRSTQKNTRLITQAITSDINTALAHTQNTTSVGGYRQDRLCLFRTLNATVTPSGSGTVYFTTGSGNIHQLHKKTFSGMPATTCVTSGGGGTLVFDALDQTLTDSDVTLVRFELRGGTDPTFIGLDLSIAPVGAMADLVDVSTHPTPTCRDGVAGSQYCSITNLTIGGVTHQELGD